VYESCSERLKGVITPDDAEPRRNIGGASAFLPFGFLMYILCGENQGIYLEEENLMADNKYPPRKFHDEYNPQKVEKSYDPIKEIGPREKPPAAPPPDSD
jgi:hypothetical protein